MKLFFLRHGDATYGSAKRDADRVLSPQGREEAEIVGKALSVLNISFTTILSSPFVRATETAEIIRSHFPQAQITSSDHLVPHAEPQQLFEELRHYSRDSNILLVTHEPFVSTCIAYLIAGSTDPKIGVKKATIACVEIGNDLHRGSGILQCLLPVAELRRLLSGSPD
jgi:phosphohistidine phosphatase